jgi:ArsR family transcriptional regulator
MDPLDALKALANPTRLRVLSWLRDPHRHFPVQEAGDPLEVGVCVKDIQQKAGVSQSTMSQYLAVLQHAGLVTNQRIGGWTYYRRDEQAVAELLARLEKEL